MADFTALKTAIQNAIKQNGNEEITGNLLQEVLLAIVTTLGDGSINDLITALGSEATTRGNADTTLQQNIDAEAQTRNQADTELNNLITGIKNNIDNGYVYAGIATPSTTPASGKVFYLALTAGTYTNFGTTIVPQGINILKYNGTVWSLDSFIGLDNAPTQGSNNLVKSGGVLDSIIKDGSAFDLSAYNSGATYADLSAALTALNALPAAYKKGGMSVKFVQSSDNKYVQARFMLSGSFTDAQFTNPANWQGVNEIPVEGSDNLITSGAIYDILYGIPGTVTLLETYEDKYINPSGTLSTGSTALTKKYDVTGMRQVKITGRQGNPTTDYALAAAYDENDSVLYVWVLTAATDYNNYLITLPTGTKYLYVCRSTNIQPIVDCKLVNENGIYNSIQNSPQLAYVECDTAASTAEKTIDLTDYILPVNGGGCIKIKMINSNTAANVTLNINSVGAKPLFYAGERASSTNSWKAGEVIEVYYDGTNYQANNTAEATGSEIIEELTPKYALTHTNLLPTGLTSASNTAAVNAYNIKGYSEVKITGRQGNPTTGYALAAFYNENEEFISAVIGTAGTNYENYSVTVPQNASTIKVCTSNTSFQATIKCVVNVDITEIIEDLTTNVDEIEDEINNLTSIILQKPLYPSEILTSTKLLPTGLTSVDNGAQIKKYDVSNYSQVKITGRQGNPTTDYALAAAYDENDSVLYVWVLTAATSYTDYFISLPTGTKYLSVCSSNTTIQPNIECKVVINSENGEGLPVHWISYMETKIETIKGKTYTIGASGDNFIFITDVHLDYNFGNSPSLIKYILNNSSIVNVIYGGDTYTTAASTDRAAKYLQDFRNSLNDVHNLYAVRGNHDTGNSLTKGHFYSIFNRPLEDFVDTLDKEVYFYKDNKSQKIRYIFCDSSSYNSAIPTTQANWITQRITELEAGWSVILVTHTYWNAVNIGGTEQVTTAGSSLKSIIDDAVDNANATVIALITGHTHADRSVQSSKGYWIISTTCDGNGTMASTYDPVTPNRVAGTTSEQAFDVFNIDTLNRKIYITRIGGNGNDREFNY